MSNIQRYELDGMCSEECIFETDGGTYVKYSDYEALRELPQKIINEGESLGTIGDKYNLIMKMVKAVEG